MKVNILVEGKTEETFIKEVMRDYLWDTYQIEIIPTIINTKVVGNGTNFKGGLSNLNYKTFIADLKRLIRSTGDGIVTTFIDYYALPSKFPGYDDRKNYHTAVEQVTFLANELKTELAKELSVDNFHPYIQLHEFEAFLFADKRGFQESLDPNLWDVDALYEVIDTFDNPEDINDRPETAPSKRVLRYYPEYQKGFEGSYMIHDIGIEKVISKCPHFRSWVEMLASIKANQFSA